MSAIKERGLERECTFTAVRSSGPGGQNVNKVATKVELAFHVDHSELLTDEEKQILTEKLNAKINEDGYMKVSDSSSRSQATNRESVVQKFYDTIEKALIKPKKRKVTKMPKAIKEQIKKGKRITAEKKANRKVNKGDWS